MPRTAKISIDGTEYEVGPLKVKDIRAISAMPAAEIPWFVFTTALKRAGVPDPDELEPTIDQFHAAAQAIMTLSGLVKTGESPPVGTEIVP